MSDMKRSRRDFVLLTAKKWLVRADHFRDSQLAPLRKAQYTCVVYNNVYGQTFERKLAKNND